MRGLDRIRRRLAGIDWPLVKARAGRAARAVWPDNWPPRLKRAFGRTGILGLYAAGIVLILAGVGYLGVVAMEPALPLKSDLYTLNRPVALTFIDSKGAVAGRRGAIVGERLKLSDMPDYLPAAFLAMEDRRFYEHGGVDPQGLLRALITDIKAGHLVQGGSTITQQVVKIVFLTPDRTLTRKLMEVSGALALEGALTKDEILELYLNRIYLGSGAYGVDGAARVYFGKSAKQVTLAEAAMLAALTTAPSAFSPRRDLAGAQARAGLVLTALEPTHVVDDKAIEKARAHPATISNPQKDQARNYFFDTAAEEARKLVPGAKGDLTILTTFDAGMQEAARASLTKQMNAQGKKAMAGQAALVAMEPDGAVRALVGGRDYAESPFNRVTQAHRQPGSAFKPFVYLTALESGLKPYTVRNDQPINIKDWSPDNYDDAYYGPITLEQALAKSVNRVAVALGQEVGLNAVIATARRMGITSPLEPNASLALGTSEVTPLELTAAYAGFASAGFKAVPYTVTEIRDPAGHTVYQRGDITPPRVIDEANVLALNAMMYQVVQTGTGRAAHQSVRDVAGKTGTSADYRDAWFVGYSAQLVAGVWVGNDDFSPMKGVTGGALPARIWGGFMDAALRKVPAKPLPMAEPEPDYQDVAYGEDGRDSDNDRDRSDPVQDFGNFIDRLFDWDDEPPPRPMRRRDRDRDRWRDNDRDRYYGR